MIEIAGKWISGGILAGRSLELRLSDANGGDAAISLRVPPPWDFTSCLGAVSSDSLNPDSQSQPPALDDLLVGLVGAEITRFEIGAEKAVLECGSLQLEKRFSDQKEPLEIADHRQKVICRINGTGVEELPMNPEPPALNAPNVSWNRPASRFEYAASGGTAIADYRIEGRRMIITHTEVPEAFRGQGIAGKLIAFAMEAAKRDGLEIAAECDYAVKYLARKALGG